MALINKLLAVWSVLRGCQLTKRNPQRRKTWLWRVLVSLDQLANALFAPLLNAALVGRGVEGPFGHEDETLSSVLGKLHYAGVLDKMPVIRAVYRTLNRIENKHCERSIECVGWMIVDIEERIK